METVSDDTEEDQIDKKNMEIKPESDDVYTNMQDLGDELPDNTPRYVLLSYPLTLVRVSKTAAALGHC